LLVRREERVHVPSLGGGRAILVEIVEVGERRRAKILDLDGPEARRERLGEQRGEHLLALGGAHQLEHVGLLRVNRRVGHHVPEDRAIEHARR
jgi:hypothetical protein